MFVSGYIYRLLRTEARDLGIRWTALMVLKDLDLLGPLNQRTLAEIEQIREPTMTVLAKQMHDRGWVRRHADRTDARAKLVMITPKGKKELTMAGEYLKQKLDDALADLSDAQTSSIESGLRPLVEMVMRRVGNAKKGS